MTLTEKLNLLAPLVSKNPIMPEYRHLFFRDWNVLLYNGVMGGEVALTAEERQMIGGERAVDAAVLLPLLSGKNASSTLAFKKQLVVSNGGIDAKLAYSTMQSPAVDLGSEPIDHSSGYSIAEWTPVIDAAMAISDNRANPTQQNIPACFEFTKEGVDLYITNDVSLSHVKMFSGVGGHKFYVSHEFLSFLTQFQSGMFHFGEKGIYITLSEEEGTILARFFCPYVEDSKYDLAEIAAKHGELRNEGMQLDKAKWEAALSRMSILGITTCLLKEGTGGVSVTGTCPAGSVSFSQARGMAKTGVEVGVQVKFLKRMLPNVSHLAFNSDALMGWNAEGTFTGFIAPVV